MLGLRYVDQRGDQVLKTAATEALAKIGAVLSPEAEARLAVPHTLPGPPPVFPSNAIALDELRAAIRAQTRLDIAYEDEQGRRTRRTVWPVQLGFMDRARILAAWCELRRDFRTFRTDRISAATPLDRYPGRRADLVRRLRAHLEATARVSAS
jgi:predicted DNA-binding transcriptional regulator YafY